MTIKPVFSGPAKEDLAKIWRHIAEHSLEAADRFVEQVDYQIELTCLHPNRGERDRRVGGCRRVLVGSYLLYYEAVEDQLRILRIFHSARRIETMQLRPEDN